MSFDLLIFLLIILPVAFVVLVAGKVLLDSRGASYWADSEPRSPRPPVKSIREG